MAGGATVSDVRLGCGGCLSSLVLLAALAAGALTAVWIGSGVVATPERAASVGSEQDGLRAQQTLFEIVRRSATRRPPAQRARHEHVLSEAEINAFLARHLGHVAGLPLTNLAVSLVGNGVLELSGRLDLREVAGDERSTLVEYLPESWRKAGVIVTLRGPLRLEAETSRGQAKSLRLDVEEAYAGRQRVPVLVLERLLAANERLSRWSVPDSVTAVTVEKGRVVVQTDS